MTTTRTCEMCGAELPSPIPHGRDGKARGGRPARYCSGACRQRAFRRRAGRQEIVRGGSGAPEATDPLDGTAEAPGGGLPRPLDEFIGRERELARLRTLLRSTRLLTLIGPGGVGKTRLALELASRVRIGRRGRAQLVELASLRDGELLPQTVAVALRVGERGGRAGVEALVHALGTRSMLLVLDSGEHVIEACAQLAATLLSRCPGLRILATGREALRVPGEVVFRVGVLALAPHGEEPGADGQQRPAEAVRLFVARARTCAPDFALRPGNAPTVAEICRRLDGLPLAVELAARRVGALSPADILRGLDDQLGLLTDGSRTGPGRHRGLGAAIDWSHLLLEPVERIVFRRLSVLEGGFDAAGAAAVCAGGPELGTEAVREAGHGAPRAAGVPSDQVLRVLCALEAKSLIVRVPGDEPNAARFRQLSAIRAYGINRLTEAGELHATWHRALDRLAGQAAEDHGSVFADAAVRPLAAERENLAAAVAYTTGRPDARHVTLALALARLHYHQEQLTLARVLLTRVLSEAEDGGFRGAALALATRSACLQADHGAALAFAEEAVTVARARRRAADVANALDALGAARLCRGEFAEAVTAFAECLDVVRPLGHPLDTALCLHHLAWALLQTGRAAAADELMAECLPTLRAEAPPGQVMAALHTAGAIRLAQGDTGGAERLFTEVLRQAPVESYHSLYPLEGLAIAAAERGDAERALRLSAAAVEMRRRIDTEPEAHWQQQVAAAAARARERLRPAAADSAVTAGRRLRGKPLTAYALRHADSAPARTAAAGHHPSAVEGSVPDPPEGLGDAEHAGYAGGGPALTARETAIARLVAEGLTNRQIAAHLDLSRSTVAGHLDRVRDKSGLRSRTQIALWISGRSPGPAR
ncbi:ATP-binding protein [Streptomyces sp. NPDC017993]|uniref:ATP-binding protein n=1 Tax=Streptomyces sp. NPDC017993 TaxID=3365027 RepID=UPI0037A7BCC2